MTSKDSTRLSFQQYCHAQSPRDRRFALILCLFVLLGALSFSQTRVIAMLHQPQDAETLFAKKSDFLLQSIRRAVVETTPRDLSVPIQTSETPHVQRSEVENAALYRLAGVRSEVGGVIRVSLTVTLATSDDTELKTAGFSIAPALVNSPLSKPMPKGCRS